MTPNRFCPWGAMGGQGCRCLGLWVLPWGPEWAGGCGVPWAPVPLAQRWLPRDRVQTLSRLRWPQRSPSPSPLQRWAGTCPAHPRGTEAAWDHGCRGLLAAQPQPGVSKKGRKKPSWLWDPAQERDFSSLMLAVKLAESRGVGAAHVCSLRVATAGLGTRPRTGEGTGGPGPRAGPWGAAQVGGTGAAAPPSSGQCREG